MIVDSTLDFEKRRNRPVKYDRELMQSTIRAMKRIEEVKQLRQQRFMEKRREAIKELDKIRAREEIVKSIDLIAPAASTLRAQADAVAAKSKAKLAQEKERQAEKA
jgi:large subunit ribosomal protein L24e